MDIIQILRYSYDYAVDAGDIALCEAITNLLDLLEIKKDEL